jgi:hypothetical protein
VVRQNRPWKEEQSKKSACGARNLRPPFPVEQQHGTGPRSLRVPGGGTFPGAGRLLPPAQAAPDCFGPVLKGLRRRGKRGQLQRRKPGCASLDGPPKCGPGRYGVPPLRPRSDLKRNNPLTEGGVLMEAVTARKWYLRFSLYCRSSGHVGRSSISLH